MGRFVLYIILVSSLLAGCAAKVKPVQEMKAPDWVKKGSGAFSKESGKVFYGVSSASKISDISLLRATADNRARNEIAKIFEAYTASLMKDYMAATSAGAAGPDAAAGEQHVEQAIKTVASVTLTGVEIVDHWQNPETGEYFSLARLDIETFKNNLAKMKELNEKAREHIKQNADKLHDELEKEEMKEGR